ncbi:alanine--tRNA ligase-like [Cornus florida]|uniref:alanine--tRNA ligase-like n=1 Tax=Cornus florida TaxID=4283 RepID=UPI0028A19BE7|nr:alanine--tRNA ligase-like [Cornus florida]
MSVSCRVDTDTLAGNDESRKQLGVEHSGFCAHSFSLGSVGMALQCKGSILVATGAQPYSGKVGECDVENFGMAYRVVADRITLSFAIAGGSCPGGVPETCPGVCVSALCGQFIALPICNEGREYFLRCILLHAVRYGTKIKIFSGLVNIVVKVMGDVFPELKQHELHTRDTIEDKEASFGKIFLYKT